MKIIIDTSYTHPIIHISQQQLYHKNTDIIRIQVNNLKLSEWRQISLHTLHPLIFKFTRFVNYNHIMNTSSNGNILRVTDPFCGEFTGHRSILLTNASDAELFFLWYAPEQTVEWTTEMPVIWSVISLIMTSLKCRPALDIPTELTRTLTREAVGQMV